MINNFTKKAGLAAAIAIVSSSAANAAIFNASASFRTIADVTITEVQALSFGTIVTGKAATDCQLTAAIASADGTVIVTANADVETTSTGCTSDDAVVGAYAIGGAIDSTITILMASVAEADFTFAPAGDYSDIEGSNPIVTTYFADAPFNVVLSDSGEGLLAVGGTLNILNDLTASTSYAVAYDVSVVY